MDKHLRMPKRLPFSKNFLIIYVSPVTLILAALLCSKLSDDVKIIKHEPTVTRRPLMQNGSFVFPTIKPLVDPRPKPETFSRNPVKGNAYEDYDFVSRGYLNFYNNVLEQRLIFTFYLKELKSHSLDPLERERLQEVCTFLIENSVRRLDVATGYDCLLQLHEREADRNSELDTFKAIKYASFSIESLYTPEVASHLLRLIISGYEDQVSFLGKNAEHLKQFCTGHRDDERIFLQNLLELNIPALNRRVMIRQSFIHTFGRSSSNENVYQHDLESVIDAMNYVRSTIQVKPTHYVDIVLNFNENFLIGAGACIASALMNSALDSFYRFHVVMDPERPLSEESQRKLASLTYIRDYSINFTLFPTGLISDLIKVKMAAGDEAVFVLYRLYFDKIFPHLDSILYLDVDTIVLTDLNALKRVDMTHYIWAAAPDPMYRYNRPECNCVLPNFYINGGVLLVNLTNMRRVPILEKIIEYIMFMDDCDYNYRVQDLINTVFPDHIYYLPFRWNSVIFWNNVRFHFNSFIVHHISTKPWEDTDRKIWENAPSTLLAHKQEWWRYREIVRW